MNRLQVATLFLAISPITVVFPAYSAPELVSEDAALFTFSQFPDSTDSLSEFRMTYTVEDEDDRALVVLIATGGGNGKDLSVVESVTLEYESNGSTVVKILREIPDTEPDPADNDGDWKVNTEIWWITDTHDDDDHKLETGEITCDLIVTYDSNEPAPIRVGIGAVTLFNAHQTEVEGASGAVSEENKKRLSNQLSADVSDDSLVLDVFFNFAPVPRMPASQPKFKRGAVRAKRIGFAQMKRSCSFGVSYFVNTSGNAINTPKLVWRTQEPGLLVSSGVAFKALPQP